MPHIAWHCPVTAVVWSHPVAVFAAKWAKCVPWDPADALALWSAGRAWWSHLEIGGSWAGFSLTAPALPGPTHIAPSAFAATDGEPQVVPLEDVARLSRDHRKAFCEATSVATWGGFCAHAQGYPQAAAPTVYLKSTAGLGSQDIRRCSYITAVGNLGQVRVLPKP